MSRSRAYASKFDFLSPQEANRLLGFFTAQGIDSYKAEYSLAGEPQVSHRSAGLIATNAVAALAADPTVGQPFVQALWDLDIPTGKYRYYDGLLTLLALLQVRGNFRLYLPGVRRRGWPTVPFFHLPKSYNQR